MPRTRTARILAGDIGATKSLLAIFDVRDGRLALVAEERLESRRFENLTALVRAFLDRGAAAGRAESVEAAAFGIAGALTDEECLPVNLAWRIHTGRLPGEIGIPRTLVLNDFQAVGRGIVHLSLDDLLTIQEGSPAPRGPIALIGAGTGLGEGFLLWEEDGYVAHASEGGHADFAPRNPIEWGLREEIARTHGHVSYERILSGPGLVSVYRYLVGSGIAAAAASVSEEMERDDPAAVITRHALAGTDKACDRALEVFISIYGAEAGNLALKVLATGGVYLAGGIAPRIAGRLRSGPFMESFLDKGRHQDLLRRMPVRLIKNPRAGLLGAAAAAAELTL